MSNLYICNVSNLLSGLGLQPYGIGMDPHCKGKQLSKSNHPKKNCPNDIAILVKVIIFPSINYFIKCR